MIGKAFFEPGTPIIVENGRFFARGVVVGPADPDGGYPEPRIKVEIFRNEIDVPIDQVRVGEMSAEKPWEDAPRDMLEDALATQAATIARLTSEAEQMAAVASNGIATLAAEVGRLTMENEALTAVVAMQVDAINDATRKRAEDDLDKDTEWYERLIDLLENYLVRQGLGRQPLAIADADLRALVAHIRD